MRNGKGFRLTLERRQSLLFYAFVSPFLIGFVFLFLYPFIQSIMFSLSELEIGSDGFVLNYIGLANYNYSLFISPDFLRTFLTSLGQMIAEVPVIIAFSFFTAVILNQKFKGRVLARLILFLPVILGAGIVLQLEQRDYITTVMQAGLEDARGLMVSPFLRDFFLQLRLPIWFLEFIVAAVDGAKRIISASGIQILIFLAGLQSVPVSLYEAAEVEGATGWERFWMITFPVLAPLIVTCMVYTIVDSFMAVDNGLLVLINDTAFATGQYGVSSAMSMLYFGAVSLILMITLKLVSGAVNRT